jgi:hypothetical protein
VARFDAAGRPDAGFGANGLVMAPAAEDRQTYARWLAITLDSEGRLVTSGFAPGEDFLAPVWTVARFLTGAAAPPPQSTPGAPAPVAAPRLRLPSAAIVDGHGVARVRVKCTSTLVCRGVLRLSRHGVRLGQAKLAVPAGGQRTARVALNRTGRRLTRRHHRLTVRATTSLTRPQAPALVAQATITLKSR